MADERFEVLFGSKLLRPETVVVVEGGGPAPILTSSVWDYMDWGFVLQCSLMGALAGAMVGQ